MKKTGRNPGRWASRARFWAFLIVLLSFFLAPLLYAGLTSFKPAIIANAPVPYLVFTPTLENYTTLSDFGFGKYFINSTVVSLATVVVSLLVGVPAGYALSRGKTRHEGILVIWLLSARIVPPVGTAIPLYAVFRRLGLLDTRAALIVVFLGLSIAMVVLVTKSFFDQIPRALDEAALVDGCVRFTAFLRVGIPLGSPGIATAAILVFLNAWNDFFFALVLTRKEASTVPLALTQFLSEFQVDWGAIMAGISLLVLPLIVFAAVVNRYFVSGLTGGALK